MASNKEMLSALIRIGKLTAQEREAFESMWDQAHRSANGKLSHKQKAWIEKVYYAQKLDQPQARPAKVVPPKIGVIYDPTAKRTVEASTFKQFEAMCPHIVKGSSEYERVKTFFANGGTKFQLRAGSRPEK